MNTLTASDRRVIISEHLAMLRHYVRKSLVHGEPMSHMEIADRDTRVQALFDLLGREAVTPHEMVRQVYRGVL